jgi:hypothetical protein
MSPRNAAAAAQNSQNNETTEEALETMWEKVAEEIALIVPGEYNKRDHDCLSIFL